MSFWEDFKKFAVKGNMVDLAIGVIIGASFNGIVNTLVQNVITPPLGYLTGGLEVSDYQWVIREPRVNAAGEVLREGVTVGYGLFLEACIDFLIVALTIFIVIRFFNTLRDKAEDDQNQAVPTPKDIELLTEIRDEMRKLNAGTGG